MSKIKGQNFRVFLDSDAVPEETNCSVTITGNTEDSSTKDTEGLWSSEAIVSRSWQVQVDSYDAAAASIKSLVTAFSAASQIEVGWDQTTGATGTQNRTAANAAFARSGQALLTDVTFSFNDRQTVTVSSQYQGTGALS